jgi:hypothetical protein
MNCEVFRKVAERSQGVCENPDCGRYGGESLQKHHIFNKFNRKLLECPETVLDLCFLCHLEIHKNRKMDLCFKKQATKNLLDAGWTKEQIMEKVGRWYGDED